MAAGTEASGTGASTVRIPSTDREDTILVASTSAGSLNKKQTDGNNRAGCSPASVSQIRRPRLQESLSISVYSAYLYFLVKHLAMNPCWSGRSSCFPGERLRFMGGGMRRNPATQRKPLNAEINFCHRAVILIFLEHIRSEQHSASPSVRERCCSLRL